ncbi:hypothetical protein O6H91_02G065700 [Diphasiastrum complanatum]|uniref:Uncharacterized protein n=6 Tax=Diphasiastrum complanatum TaxID=34168 RepID=A0ACC2EG91_DIPCM|nr:hypothetical protein O6H91_02G065700 [Diphasiastrum complanatum]KAJ7565574.1 hypothetical protein O6H91_02G065700 [Diphasiastrum complanatum]KAJ7565576.1 hypothetical protein O6H91_02G065700 [Diphasiastrum complanatum]KAJ7565577.1 hypothetical protein O6H91_02G065700 [Diphasiastrum complanatum]KAJ7565578.1 hypothetical protein O6H91_02G065700 [Diphasiastrum complanatum]
MDAYEPAKIVYSKVQALEPDNVSKIMGYLLLEGNGNQEMLSLAFGPDSMLQSAIFKAKEELGLSSYRGLHPPTNLIATEQWSSELSPNSSHPLQFYSDVSPYLSPLSPHLFPRYLNHLSTSAVSQVSQFQSKNLSTKSPLCLSPLYIPESHPYLHFSAPSSPWESGTKTEKSPKFSSNNALHQNQAFTNAFSPTDCRIQKLQGAIEQQDSPRGVFVDEQYHQLPSSPLNNRLSLNRSSSRLSPVGVSSSHAVPSLSWKPCLYFSRGYCKHGGSCRFMHTSMTEGSTSSSPRSELRDLHGEEGLQSGSVERLELELQELLRGKKAPVSIASLPQLYYEHFGKTLQADGYLTESRRHGKAGYSLTKLLARLKSTVTLIDRPHGQHAVVLAEDAHNYASKGEQDELRAANPISRQIYLTFPAESTFTEEDVSLHFKAYGPVEDVRIPFQQRRMFGFVTFAYPETVKQILSGGNPHYICGARVLVKPYREKSKLNDRKHLTENIIYSLHGSSGSNNFSTQALAAFGNDSYFRELQEEQILELERKLAELKIKDAQQMHPESEAVTMYHDGVDPALTHSPNRAYMAQVELPSLTLHDDSLCNMYISEPNTVDPAAAHGFVPNGGYVSSLSTEDMHQLPSNDPFAYLLDVLDNDVGDDMMSSGAKDGAQTIGHNLPDSLFTSALAQDMVEPFHPSEILDLAQICQTGEFVARSQIPVMNHSVTCCICLEYFADPIRLECSHIFCLQCILKVIKSSKDECPMCQKHIGNQVYKIFQNIDQPSWLSGIQNQSVAQQIW